MGDLKIEPIQVVLKWDDQADDVMYKLNKALSPMGLRFEILEETALRTTYQLVRVS